MPDPPLTLSTAQDEPLLPTRASSPTPSQQQQHRPRPLSTATRALLALAAVTLTLYLLAAPSSTRSPLALAPLEAHHAAHPAERLAQLNADYDPHREGYGVGSTDLRAYAAGLRRTLAQVLARGSGEGRAQGAMPDDDDEERDGLAPPLVDDDALADALECRLALDGRACPAAARAIPPDLYATARTVSPVPSALQSWLGGGASASASPLRLHLLSSEAIVAFIARRFPALSQAYAALPIPILRYDLFRLVVLAARGGVYTDADTRLLRPFPRAEWPADVDDRTDPALRLASASASLSGNSTSHADAPPALVIGLEWASASPARAQENARNALYNREAGVVQWTFGAAAGHPVLLDAVRRVLRHTERVATLEREGEGAGEGEGEGEGGDEERWKEDGVDEGPLQFDPRAERMVLEWSGPAVLTDSVARCVPLSLSCSLLSPSPC